MRSGPGIKLAMWLGLIGTSCISGSYTRQLDNRPLLELAQAQLPQNGVDLGRCLDVLGAPTLVFEYQVHGLLLVYAWNQQRVWNASVSIPTGESVSPSFSFADIRDNEQGVVLKLDENWQLTEWKHGYLRALIGAEPRPATLDQLESS